MERRTHEGRGRLQSTPSGRHLPMEFLHGPAMRTTYSCEHTMNKPSSEKQEVLHDLSRLSMKVLRLVVFPFNKLFRKGRELELERESEVKTALIEELTRGQQEKEKQLRNVETDLSRARRNIQEIQTANDSQERWFRSSLAEKEQALQDAQSHASHFETQCQTLKSQLAMIEQKAAQESLASGSYPDDRANPGMLEVACKAVDKATEDLARFLHNISITKLLPPNSAELQQFVGLISPAHMEDFSRPIQVKNAWSHWICVQMFQNFEHVFFDVDGGRLTSPSDPKKHALECFQSFQLQQSATSLDSDAIFQAFCSRKYRSVFPEGLVNQALLSRGIVCDENGRFDGDRKLHECFLDVARAVWLLHRLAFSFDPPASILRMARGTPFDKQFHEPVIHVEDNHGMSHEVMLMIRPAFRVRQSIIRSRVQLCKRPK